MESNQKDGYLPTGRAGDTTMVGWMRKTDKLRRTNTQQTGEEGTEQTE